jgi:hypothetical protein
MSQPNKNYEFIDKSDYSKPDDVATVRIVEGEFQGVEFTFGTINVNESAESATISFDYAVHNNDEIEKSPEVKEQFEVLLGEVLNDILYSALLEAEKRYLNEHRKEDSETPTE